MSSIVPATAQARLSAAAAALALGADERAVVGHTVMVGSSNASGDRSAFSSAGEDLRVLGEDIAGVCLTDDVVGPGGEAPRCVGGEMISSGSSAAAPQVSGIAAMLLGASTRETAATVRARLLDAASDDTIPVAALNPALEGLRAALRMSEQSIKLATRLRYFERGGEAATESPGADVEVPAPASDAAA